ncbi:MerC domain-containing protein [Alteromonadaceae bacterium BrNp21-10]|nr:MerC domain-containing protein [Alteromonadaceae bacterium BrNp21-10]
MSISKNGILDRFGIWISSLCAFHCLVLPVALPMLPLLGIGFFGESWFERTILSTSLLIGFWALFSGFYRYHRKIYPLYCLLIGGLIYWNKGMFGDAWEPITIAVGAMLIVFAHVSNLRLCNLSKQNDES